VFLGLKLLNNTQKQVSKKIWNLLLVLFLPNSRNTSIKKNSEIAVFFLQITGLFAFFCIIAAYLLFVL